MLFPFSYPTLPPLVTFSTDVFHPLLTPLTTYTYTTGSSDTDTVSATDEERLPPGGFSLRHGFPQWFGRARRSAPSSRNVSGSGRDSPAQNATPVPTETRDASISSAALNSMPVMPGKEVTIVKVLEYIRSTFCDESVLDSVPLEAAANPGAFHAWRAHRAELLSSPQHPSSPASPTTNSADTQASATSALGRNRRPGEWNWEGVWEKRVKEAVKVSLSEPVLFGGSTAGEDIVGSSHSTLVTFVDVSSDTFPQRRRRNRGRHEKAARVGAIVVRGQLKAISLALLPSTPNYMKLSSTHDYRRSKLRLIGKEIAITGARKEHTRKCTFPSKTEEPWLFFFEAAMLMCLLFRDAAKSVPLAFPLFQSVLLSRHPSPFE
jgi:hypothetical protein